MTLNDMLGDLGFAITQVLNFIIEKLYSIQKLYSSK